MKKIDIDLSEYTLVNPESIKKCEGIRKFYDIEVEDDNTFYIVGKNNLILSHNCDGNAIAGLLLNFFYKFWPELFDYNMIYKVETPIIVVKNIKTKNKTSLYNNEEYEKWCKGKNMKDWEIKYKKGLAALVDDEYEEIIKNPKLTLITADTQSKESLKVWFGDESDLRKEAIMKTK